MILRKTRNGMSLWWPDLRRHVYIVGPSGSGKSSALYNLCRRMADGFYGEQGFALIDPHGDLAQEDVLAAIPRSRLQQTIWFDPTDTERPFGLNIVPFSPGNPLIAEHTLEAFATIWKLDQETERLLKHIFIVHSYLPDSTLFECLTMLNNQSYRDRIVARCANPLSRQFWQSEFPVWEMTPRFRADRVGPVASMFETLLQHQALQRIFGQAKNTVDFRKVMDAGQIMICSLARGALGDQASILLGAILLAQFRSAAYSRIDLPQSKRRPFVLLIDEFHELTAGEAGGRALQGLFSGGRKFGLSLVVAHQGEYQDPVTVKAALSNCFTKIAYAVNTDDLEREFRIQEFRDAYFESQGVWVKEGIDNIFSGIPQLKMLPDIDESLSFYSRREQVVSWSRERFGRSGRKVQRQIERRFR